MKVTCPTSTPYYRMASSGRDPWPIPAGSDASYKGRSSRPRSADVVKPERVVVGVTGHRWQEDPPALAGVVGDVLEVVRSLVDPGEEVVVVSPLAEGADRLVAAVALELGLRLECVLPLAVDDYERDFASKSSVERFRRLLGGAASVSVVPGRCTDQDRTVAYAEAGRAVVDGSDVLIAVWDGRPSRGRGGTAEIVDAALAADRTVVWIHPDPPHAVRVLTGCEDSEIAAALAQRLEGHRDLPA
jgi:hypothetical protein